MAPFFKEMDAKHPTDLIYAFIVLTVSIELFFLGLKLIISLLKGLDGFAQALHALVVQEGHVIDLQNGSKKAFSSNGF